MDGAQYPDLGDMSIEESDPLPPLQSTVTKSRLPPPKRPPPPRSASAPSSMITGSTPKVPPYESSTSTSLNTATMLPSASFPENTCMASSPFSSPSLSDGAPRQIAPLKPHEVRWFYEESGKAWTPFNGHDSLCLEDCYQRLQRQRGSGGECDVSVLGDTYEANLADKMCKPIYWTDKPRKILRGTWFEVSSEKWYPLEEQDSILVEKEHCRMSWRNRASEQQRLKKVSAGSPADSSKPCETVMNRLSLEKYEVLWMANDTIFKQKKEITSQLWSMVGERLGKGQAYGAARLQRGYKDAASHEHREPPIGHLVLIVHGIGQNMESSDICKDSNSLRSTCAQVAKKKFPEDWAHGRVEFLPCEWRTWLTLDKGVINTITPQGLKMVRGVINDTVLDVMFYLSPKYGPEIMDGLRFSINKQYREFMKRNPNFSGTVSVFAHSLGSVLVYDLLLETCEERGVQHSDLHTNTEVSEGETGKGSQPKKKKAVENPREVKYSRSGHSLTSSLQSSTSPHQHSPAGGEDEIDFRVGGDGEEEGEGPVSNGSIDPQASRRAELARLKQRVAELESQLGMRKKRGLKFTIDHFFAVGSPLPLFLVMREHDCLIKKGHRGAASLLPTCICKRVHNLHHPADPIAYRLEPLVNSLYAQVKPVKLDSASSKPSKDMVDLAQGPQTEKPVAPMNKGWSFPLFSSKKTEPPPQTKVPDGVVNDDKLFVGGDRLKERLDFVMKESVTDISYISSIMAHFSYWSSQDCAQYLLLQLYTYKPTGQ
ncbi:Phospholipase DDHD1 [Geodia barretti]|uniref:Phospholipase DDHD1 n=2 Tax=Geodia barretti TaxID=519541 RepID=A0AA35XMM8_GEOBA|nr:Phospholipase DDHD1 [Geodia barretti]